MLPVDDELVVWQCADEADTVTVITLKPDSQSQR